MAVLFLINKFTPVKCISYILYLLAGLPATNKYKNIATDDNNSYYKDLSKTKSGWPSRQSLAFFVLVICLTSQVNQIDSTAPYYLSQGNTVYDGVTSQNKIALGQICGAAAFSAESEPRHPILSVLDTVYSVALTQKLKGDSYHG